MNICVAWYYANKVQSAHSPLLACLLSTSYNGTHCIDAFSWNRIFEHALFLLLNREMVEAAAQKSGFLNTTSDGKGLVVVTWANTHYYDFVLNWVYHLNATGCKSYLVGGSLLNFFIVSTSLVLLQLVMCLGILLFVAVLVDNICCPTPVYFNLSASEDKMQCRFFSLSDPSNSSVQFHIDALQCAGAMDEPLLIALVSAGIPAFSMSAGLSLDDFGWGSPQFHKMGRVKISLIQTFTQWGQDVLISDVDTVWLKNPVEYMAKVRSYN